MTRIPFDTMQDTVKQAFIAAGLNAETADICARIHTETSCDGIYSHGLNRVARFVDYVNRKWIDITAEPQKINALGSLEIYDGQRGIGITNALFATERAMTLAKEYGIGMVALRNTTHWMRGGTYGWHAARQGFAAMMWTNTESCMPAWGGKDLRLGNNPFVMAIPRAEGPLVLDMAMSQYSYGKLQVTRLNDEQLPFPGGFDTQGNLTRDPGAIEASMRILPTGYWKGSGLAMLLDGMAAMLAGGLATHEIDGVQQGSCTGACQIFMVFNPARLGGSEFTARLADSLVNHVQAAVPAEEQVKVRYPGQMDLQRRRENLRLGIPVNDDVWQEVLMLARQ